MKPVVLVSLLLSCSGALVAQQSPSFNKAGMESPNNPQSAVLTQTVILPASHCPIGMHARQGSSPQMEWASDGTKKPIISPSLELTLRDQRAIVGATVTVRGYTGKGGAVVPATGSLVLKDGDSRKEVSRPLTLRFQPSEPGKVLAQYSLDGFTVIESIELNSVTYADGSTWKLAADAGCRVAPDPLLLISGR